MTEPSFEPGDQDDDTYVICPYCGGRTGDCDEWVTQNPLIHTCSDCGKRYRAWAEYTATYYTELLEEE